MTINSKRSGDIPAVREPSTSVQHGVKHDADDFGRMTRLCRRLLIWTAPRLVAVLFVCGYCAISLAAEGETTSADDRSKSQQKMVKVVIDFADGAQKIVVVPWKNDMTLGQAMDHVAKHPHGAKIKRRGAKATAFIEQIDDLKNQGARGRNWIFRVNGRLGKKSYAVTELEPGDTALWKFDEYP